MDSWIATAVLLALDTTDNVSQPCVLVQLETTSMCHELIRSAVSSHQQTTY